MAEGYLDVIDVFPPGAHVDDLVDVTITFQNIGETADDFQWIALDQDNNELGSGGFTNLAVGPSVIGSFSFTMPDYDFPIIIYTYHYQEGTWVWSSTTLLTTSVWNEDYWWPTP